MGVYKKEGKCYLDIEKFTDYLIVKHRFVYRNGVFSFYNNSTRRSNWGEDLVREFLSTVIGNIPGLGLKEFEDECIKLLATKAKRRGE